MTQASIPELRNSNRLITQFFSAPVPKLEIVINRYEPRMLGVSEEHITKALTRPAQWKIPNDYAVGAEHADQRHAAGAFGFGDLAADSRDGRALSAARTRLRPARRKDSASTFSVKGMRARNSPTRAEGKTWNC